MNFGKGIVFVGLGNPGKKYEMTRHNMGYLVVQALAHKHGVSWKENKSRFLSNVAKCSMQGVPVHLLLPTTYMNESGQAVRKYLDYCKLPPQNIVVVCDDVALNFFELRLRKQGSSGGHNGLESIERHLGTKNYIRLRMGIGRQEVTSSQMKDYVLDAFNKEENSALPAFLNKGVEALEMLLTMSVDNVMNIVNVRNNTKKTQEKGIE